jgi:hypothetical protein
MLYQVENQFGWYADKPVYRIVNYFFLIQTSYILCKSVNLTYTLKHYFVIFC